MKRLVKVSGLFYYYLMPGNLVYFNLVSFVHNSVPDVTRPVFTSKVLMAESDLVAEYKELHYQEKKVFNNVRVTLSFKIKCK